jgi:malonyl-CoA O-methyltransferase
MRTLNKKNAIRDSFNKAMSTYDEYCDLQWRVGNRLLGKIEFNLNPLPTLLDLGCGTGLITERVAQKIPHQTFDAIDIADQLLLKARQRLSPLGVSVHERNFDSLNSEKKYDIIFSNLSLHWSNGFNTLLGKLRNSLSPKGTLAFTVPLLGTFSELQSLAAMNHFLEFSYVEQQLKRVGYTIKVAQSEKITLHFKTTRSTLESIKYTGTNCVFERKKPGLYGKTLLSQPIHSLTYVIGYFIVS